MLSNSVAICDYSGPTMRRGKKETSLPRRRLKSLAAESEGVVWRNSADQEEQNSRKRRLILKTAAKIFARDGYQKTTIDAIAAALRVTKPTIYYYFDNKEDLYFQITTLALQDLDQTMSLSESEGASGRDKLRAFCISYGEFMLTDVGVCITAISDKDLGPAFRRRWRAQKTQFEARLRSILEEGRRDGSIVIDDPMIFSAALFGALNWASQWFNPKGRLSAKDVADSIYAIFARAARA